VKSEETTLTSITIPGTNETKIPEGSESASRKEVNIHQDPFILARLFIERYGSYSTDSNSIYLEELLPLVSQSFKSVLLEKIQEIKENPPTEFYGQTTKIISFSEEEKDETQAKFKAQVMIEKTTGKKTEVSYEEGTITLVFEDGEWKVASCDF
jgi:hypothetical protein